MLATTPDNSGGPLWTLTSNPGGVPVGNGLAGAELAAGGLEEVQQREADGERSE